MATASAATVRAGRKPFFFDAWRVFIALWYLGGFVIHFLCALDRPYIYARFGTAPLYPMMGRLWNELLMPHITFFALLLSGFELVVFILLLSRGRMVKIALTGSILFNLFLVQLGLGYPHNFLLNRLPNLLFVLVQLPLYWVDFEKSLPALIRVRISHVRADLP